MAFGGKLEATKRFAPEGEDVQEALSDRPDFDRQS
jgi:hypothetical protein